MVDEGSKFGRRRSPRRAVWGMAAALAGLALVSAMLAVSHMPELERLLFQLVGLGFALLSAALLTGLAFIEDWLAQHLAHKTVLSVTAWMIFGGLLWGRWQFGLRGRAATRWTLAGYGVLILAYFGSKLVLEIVLDARWSLH